MVFQYEVRLSPGRTWADRLMRGKRWQRVMLIGGAVALGSVIFGVTLATMFGTPGRTSDRLSRPIPLSIPLCGAGFSWVSSRAASRC
jgi:hypothetical protein